MILRLVMGAQHGLATTGAHGCMSILVPLAGIKKYHVEETCDNHADSVSFVRRLQGVNEKDPLGCRGMRRGRRKRLSRVEALFNFAKKCRPSATPARQSLPARPRRPANRQFQVFPQISCLPGGRGWKGGLRAPTRLDGVYKSCAHCSLLPGPVQTLEPLGCCSGAAGKPAQPERTWEDMDVRARTRASRRHAESIKPSMPSSRFACRR